MLRFIVAAAIGGVLGSLFFETTPRRDHAELLASSVAFAGVALIVAFRRAAQFRRDAAYGPEARLHEASAYEAVLDGGRRPRTTGSVARARRSRLMTLCTVGGACAVMNAAFAAVLVAPLTMSPIAERAMIGTGYAAACVILAVAVTVFLPRLDRGRQSRGAESEHRR